VLSEHLFSQGCLSPHDSQDLTQYLPYLSCIHLGHREGRCWVSCEIRMMLLHSVPCPSPLRSKAPVQLLNKQAEIMSHYHSPQYIFSIRYYYWSWCTEEKRNMCAILCHPKQTERERERERERRLEDWELLLS